MLSPNKEYVTDTLFGVISFLGIALLLARFGFHLSQEEKKIAEVLTNYLLAFFLGAVVLRRFLFEGSWSEYLRNFATEILISVIASFYFFDLLFFYDLHPSTLLGVKLDKLSLTYVAATHLAIALTSTLQLVRRYQAFMWSQMNPNRLMIISFFGGAVIGTILLKLPKATYQEISWTDAAFTAVSSLCVTGLLPFELTTTFTTLGLIVILGLIQVGGLGIMTLTMTFFSLFPGSLSIRESILVSKLLSDDKLKSVKQILRQIVFVTVFTEVVGAVGLYLSSEGHHTFDYFFECLFHSISAFCNAGMTIFSQNRSLGYNLYTGIICILIIVGGIGFPVIQNVIDKLQAHRKTRQEVRIHLSSKLTLITTAALLTIGTILVYILEHQHSLKGLEPLEQVFNAFFLSVSTRTAGFSISSLTSIHSSTLIFLMMLMLVGASPGSTGGGIKTLNFAIIMLGIRSIIVGHKDVNVFSRRLSTNTLIRSYGVLFVALFLSSIAMIGLFYLEPSLSGLPIAFEVISAVGTVGLSVDLTAQLSHASKWLVIALMFAGRIGPYALLVGIWHRKTRDRYRYLEDDIQIY